MISHKHKFIFIHIPKCGGSSVEQSLLELHDIPQKDWEEYMWKLEKNLDCTIHTMAKMYNIKELTNTKMKTKKIFYIYICKKS